MKIALCLVYCFFVCSASDGAACGRSKSGKGGGIGPGASPVSATGRNCSRFLNGDRLHHTCKKGGLLVASPSSY